MKYKHVWSVNGTSYSGEWTLPNWAEKKDLSFEDLAGPVNETAIPHTARKRN